MTEKKKDHINNSHQEEKEEELDIDFTELKNKAINFFKKLTKEEKKEKTTEKQETTEIHHNEHQEQHSEHKEHHHEHQKHHHEAKEHQETISRKKEQEVKEETEEISLDFTKIAAFSKNNAKWLIPLACILIAMFFSIYLRTMPLRMPIADEWAQSTVNNYYKGQLTNQIDQQYPNLPQQNKDILIEKEWQSQYQQNKARIENDLTQVSQQYKNQFRDDNGTLYLLGIDPWHYYRVTDNILKYGHQGTTLKDGVTWDEYFMAPEGRWGGKDFHAYFGSFLHKFMNLFSNYPLMFTFFLIGTIFSALAVIPAFFIGRRITGNTGGGFFTAMLIAVSAFFVSRTTGESSDTDVYVVFFPLLITWLFLEAFEAKELKKKMIWISLAGISTGFFSIAWLGGWWYVMDFIIATIGIYLFYLLAKELLVKRDNFISNIIETLRSKLFLNSIYILMAYLLTTTITISIIDQAINVYYGLLGPFNFLQLKAVAVNSLWPNILTTVAELNVAPLSEVINQLGGRLLFALAILGILFTVIKKDEEKNHDVKLLIFLSMWFIASLYATTKGIRFTLQATPVFAIAFGAFLGITWHYLSQWTAKELKINITMTQIIAFVLLALLLIQPIKAGYDQAYRSVPSMNDGWYNTLKKIDLEGDKNAIINSWWDFGHWFKAIANRPVTFDGAAQTSWGAHWIGKSLLTDNEKHTIGILRMMNCGQNKAFEELDKILQDTHKSVQVLDEIITLKKEEAIKTLKNEGLTNEQVAAVIKYTHCNAPTDYYIMSDDMIGKAGVWGHFGSWDFNKAEMYMQSKNLNKEEAIKFLTSNYNFTIEQADQTYYQIQNTPADQWISPWPSYVSGINPCQKESEMELVCNVGMQQGTVTFKINMKELTVDIKNNGNEKLSPTSLVYATKESILEKKFSETSGIKLIPYSFILIPQEDGNGNVNYGALLSDPRLADSTFTKLYFFGGHGVKCFSKFDEARPFTGGKISTWKVDYDCQQKNQIFFLPKEELHAAHILLSPSKYSEEEALKLVTEIKRNLTVENFGEYAKLYSEDPGSKDNNGDLGWFGKGVMVPEFEQTAFKLKEGEISEPVKSRFGYHLILLKEKRMK